MQAVPIQKGVVIIMVAMVMAIALKYVLMGLPSFTTERYEEVVLVSLFYLTFREIFKRKN